MYGLLATTGAFVGLILRLFTSKAEVKGRLC